MMGSRRPIRSHYRELLARRVNMDEELVRLIIVNFPNYLGFLILTLVLNRLLTRVLGLIERCIGDDYK